MRRLITGPCATTAVYLFRFGAITEAGAVSSSISRVSVAEGFFNFRGGEAGDPSIGRGAFGAITPINPLTSILAQENSALLGAGQSAGIFALVTKLFPLRGP